MSEPAAPAAPPSAVPAQRTGALRSTLVVSVATLGSRLLGLVRDQIFASFFGAGPYAEAFVVAFRIPNLLRDLFAEGALSAAFVPTFTKVDRDGGPEAGHLLANRVTGALLMLVGGLTILGIVLADPLVGLLASGYGAVEGKHELTVLLTRLMMPFLLVVSLAAVMMGMLNSRQRFATPAAAPTLFNVAAIVVGLALWAAGAEERTAVIGWAIGTVLGGILQLAIQLPPLYRDGYRLWPVFSGITDDPGIRRIAALMAPATIGLAATQLNIAMNTQFASHEPGANSWLNYAFRLLYVPIGIFGVAIATVTQAGVAKRAADLDYAGLKDVLARGLRHTAFLTVPSAVGLVVLGEPIIGMLYEGGRFKPSDTEATAIALAGYSVGLYAYSAVKVIAPAFYALNRARWPLVASASAVAINLGLNLAFHDELGYVGLSLGISLGAIGNVVVLLWAFSRLSEKHPWPSGLPWQLFQVSVASAVMGVAVWAAIRGVHPHLSALHGRPLHLVESLIGVAVGATVYAAICALLGVGELQEVTALFRRRLGR